jgi:hypothetical protein
VDLNIKNPKIQLIHSKLEHDQSEKNLKKFCHKSPQVQNFTTKRKSATIEAKDIFGKIDPRKKKVEIQTIASCMSLGYNRVPNNFYFPL